MIDVETRDTAPGRFAGSWGFSPEDLERIFLGASSSPGLLELWFTWSNETQWATLSPAGQFRVLAQMEELLAGTTRATELSDAPAGSPVPK